VRCDQAGAPVHAIPVRPSDPARRAPRAAVGAWLLVLAVLAAGWLLVHEPPTSAAAGLTQPSEVHGDQVYAATCAACHGVRGEGRVGEATGVEAGPPIRGLEVAYHDQLLRTGRMPIREPQAGITRDQLTAAEREAVIGWMTEAFGLVGQIPEVGEGDRGRGHELYAISCSACHGATGQGGIGAEGTRILGVAGLDRVAVAEAIRVGPFDMPRFDEAVLDDDDLAAVATFVSEDLSNPPRTPLGLAEMHRVTFWALAGALAVALVAAVVLVARPVRAPADEATAEPER
jgi:ubiquinol-cytochrome c reductase cytochrome c subunit